MEQELFEKLTNNGERPVADAFADLQKPERDRMSWIASNIVGKKVLDIGCSTGYLSTLLDDSYKYFGVDYDEAPINHAKEVHKHRANVAFRRMGLAELKYSDEEIADTIVASEVIEHLEDGLDYIPKLRKMCKRLIITVPNRQFWQRDVECHKLFNLTEDSFSGAKVVFYDYRDGKIKPQPIVDCPAGVWSNIYAIYDKGIEYDDVERMKLGINGGRPLVNTIDDMYPHEKDRIAWIASNIVGNKVLDIGCNTGYLSTLLSDKIVYDGWDYNAEVVDYANNLNLSRHNVNFENKSLSDIDSIIYGEYDTIVAAEVLEHLEDGLDYIPKLRKICKRLIVTTPYRENFYWHLHKIRGITEASYQGAKVCYYHENANKFSEEPLLLTNAENKCTIFAIYDEGVEYDTPKPVKTLTAYICTKGRYESTLPLAIQSIIMQTVKPTILTIVDDNPQDKRIEYDKHPLYAKLMAMARHNGISFNVIISPGELGPAANHQAMLSMCQTDLLLRVDDDDAYEPDVIEKMLAKMEEGYDAVAPYCPYNELGKVPVPFYAKAKISDYFYHYSPQLYYSDEDIEVEHFNNTFMFDVKKVKDNNIMYPKGLSPVGHREETRFSHDIFRAGMKMCVVGGTVAWHYKYPGGGIRQNAYGFFWEADDREYYRYFYGLGYKDTREDTIPVVLGHGYGDTIMFMNVIDELASVHKDKLIIVGTAFKEVFDFHRIEEKYSNIKVLHINEVLGVIYEGRIKGDPIYNWMNRNQWKGHIIDAYREIYINQNIWDVVNALQQ